LSEIPITTAVGEIDGVGKYIGDIIGAGGDEGAYVAQPLSQVRLHAGDIELEYVGLGGGTTRSH